MNKDTARHSEVRCTSVQCSVTLGVCWRLLVLETRHYFLRSAKEITPKSVIQVPPLYLSIVAWLHSQETMCLAQNLTCRSEKFRDMLQCHMSFRIAPRCLFSSLPTFRAHEVAPGISLESIRSLWDETLRAVQCPPHPAIQLGPWVACSSSPNLQRGRRLTLSRSAFSTCSKHHNLPRGLMGCDKAMSPWEDEPQLCCSHTRGAEQKILHLQHLGKQVPR